jgi:HK97 family phage major capsid protein
MATEEKKVLGNELPLLVREFEILEIKPAKKRAAKPGKSAKRATLPGEPADAPESDEDDPDKETDGLEENAADGDGADGDAFDIAISSEYPVQRWYGTEILDHSSEAVDLSRAKRGLSFLDSHKYDSVIGIVENVAVDKDKKLRGQVRFSRGGTAQQIKQDIQDGIRRFISVGYAVNEMVLEKSSKDEGDTYRATRWTPMEVSSVGVPADPTVGNDRGADGKLYPVLVRSNVSPATKPNPKEAITVETNVQAINDSRNAAAEIIRLGKQHGIDSERVAEFVGGGKTVAEFSQFVLEQLRGKATPIATPAAEVDGPDRLDLTDREQASYNLARGIMVACSNIEAAQSRLAKRDSCLELEISEEIEKRWNGPKHGGFYVPWSIRHAITPEIAKRYPQLQKRAGLSGNVATEGQELIFTEPGEFIQFLYNRMRVKQLGARTLSGLRENISFPKQTGKVSGSWVGENPGSDVADAALTLGSIASSPHTYQSSTSYSRQLLAQAVVDVDTMVREDLSMDLALAVDSVAINGGGTNQPKGILSTTGVQSFVLVADAGNGGAPAWDDIVNMTKTLETVNADQLGEGGWLTTPACKAKLKRVAKLGNTLAIPIWLDDEVDGYKAASSNQVPSNLVKGTSGAICSALIRGVFETMLINMWGSGFEMIVDPYRLKKQGMIEITTFMMTDVVLKYPNAFVVAQDVLTA